MPTRTRGEKERIEKRVKTERIVMLCVGLLAVALFVVLGFIFGGFGGKNVSPEASPEPTPDPRIGIAEKLKDALGGSVTDSEENIFLTYRSDACGASPVIRLYLVSSVPCAKITLQLPQPEVKPTDMFSDIGDPAEEGPDPVIDEAAKVAKEADAIVSVLTGAEETGTYYDSLNEAVVSLLNGSGKKTSVVCGIYVVTLEFSESDRILIITCEPA